jgi:DNA polymerase-1
MEMERDCLRCGLRDEGNRPVPDDGGDYTILAVGEAPGVEEDAAGRPFVGKSGKILRKALRDLGYPEDKVTYTNVVLCRPPDNKISRKYIKCCYTGIPIKENTKLVLLFGNTPLNAVLGESGIMSWSGVRVERGGIIYAPMIHPAYFTYSGEQNMDGWLTALDEALSAWRHGDRKAADEGYEIKVVYSQHDIRAMAAEVLKSPKIAVDTEIGYLDPFKEGNRVLIISVANDRTSWVIPIDHPDDLAPLGHESVDALLNVLEAHPHIVCHNAKFDQMMLDHLLDCRFEAKGDSMLASFLVESKSGIHGLKRLAGFYLGMFEYDSELRKYVIDNPQTDPSRGGSYEKIPLNVLIPYAAKDAIATYCLEDVLLDKLSPKQRILYNELMIPCSNTLYRIQLNGMAVDFGVAERYRRLYGRAVADTLERIRGDRMVRKYVRKRKVDSPTFEFNSGSSQQKAEVLFGPGYYRLKAQSFTPKKAPSTSRDAIEPHRASCPLVNDLVMYGMLSKMMGTYIEPVANKAKLSGDDRARSSFNQHVVETGRLSSSGFSKDLGFNQQNIPVPEKEPGTILEFQPIKNMFTHTFEGGCLLAADYSGMELRVFASLARCDAMIEIHKSGRDFHTMVGSMVSGKPYEEITKPERYRYKWTSWTLLYGGSAYTLHRMYGIPLQEAERIVEQYYAQFPEVPQYLKECVKFARKHGYIETPFGLRRPLPDITAPEEARRGAAEREAVNTPVQGAAGMLTLMALVIIDKLMLDAGFKSMIVNTVHDSILTDVYPGELDALVGMQKDVMENLSRYAELGIDLSWLICPLKADFEVGTHYGSMKPYKGKEEASAG